MTDRHMRALRRMARQTQRALGRQSIRQPAGDDASTGRRDYREPAAQIAGVR